ncbi:MAG: dienelactone hydrolase family protein [Burkholderiaceae bacterium]|nr:dienelactone hydrolase family protein [Burkholderiaceae bacterium]
MAEPTPIQQELDSHRPARAFSRRDFVRTSVGSGFAAAVLPVAADTVIRTPADGLLAGEVTIDVAGFQLPAYRAAPASGGDLPVVLVVSEIFGVHEHIADVARRFARQGYLAIAPELFVRQGDPSGYGEIARLMAEVISQVPDAQVMNDLDACVAWAGRHGGDLRRVAVTGFCWGGRISWLYAAHSARVRSGVAWYGRLVGQPTVLQPRHPVDLAGELKAPVLGLYGEKDGGIPLDSVERMRAALAQGGAAARQSDFIVYPGAGHAFHADYRPSYLKAAADDGWQRCLGWFRRHGVA